MWLYRLLDSGWPVATFCSKCCIYELTLNICASFVSHIYLSHLMLKSKKECLALKKKKKWFCWFWCLAHLQVVEKQTWICQVEDHLLHPQAQRHSLARVLDQNTESTSIQVMTASSQSERERVVQQVCVLKECWSLCFKSEACQTTSLSLVFSSFCRWT